MFINTFELVAGTTLEEFAEAVRDNLQQEWWATASLFEIRSFGKKRTGDQEFYLANYRVRENPRYCILDVTELIALGSLPSVTQGIRVRHQACDWELSGRLVRARNEALDSFRIITKPAEYYTQFLNVKDITIKANEKVNPLALQQAAKIVSLMLDGRQDIADCISNAGSSFAIFPKVFPVTDLPEFSYLQGQKDMWGRPYESGEIFGLGGVKGNPVSATSEQSLVPEPQYPHQGYWVAVHELAHHLMNLCFSEQDYTIWKRLRRETLEADLGLDIGLMINVDEFFAGLTTVYFSIDSNIPRRHLDHFPSEIFMRLEELYGALDSVETDDPRYIRHVSSSGVRSLWVMDAERTYEDDVYGYSIELPTGWEAKLETPEELRLVGPSAWIDISYTPLRRNVDVDMEINHLTESRRAAWKRWTRTWAKSEVESSERDPSDDSQSYWIRYRGHESSEYCEITRVERILVASHEQRNYAIVLEGNICGAGTPFAALHDLETMLRSFSP